MKFTQMKSISLGTSDISPLDVERNAKLQRNKSRQKSWYAGLGADRLTGGENLPNWQF
jgi:hypothetical protein